MAVIDSGLTSFAGGDTALVGWHDLVATTNVDTTTEAEGYPATNLANTATHLLWRGGVNTGDELITVTVNSADELDYVAVARHNWGTIAASVSIEVSTNNSPNDFVTVCGPTTLTDDLPTIFRFTPQSVGTLRVRLAVSASEPPEAAVLYVGALLDLGRGVKADVEHVPIAFGRRTSVVNGMSENGQFLGRIVLSEHRETKAEFFGFTKEFYDSDIDAFLDAAQESPFFFAYAPEEYPAEVGFVWLINNAEPGLRPDTGTRIVSLTLEMRGIA